MVAALELTLQLSESFPTAGLSIREPIRPLMCFVCNAPQAYNTSLCLKAITAVQNLCFSEPNLGKLAFKNWCDLSMNWHKIGYAFLEVCAQSQEVRAHVCSIPLPYGAVNHPGKGAEMDPRPPNPNSILNL